MGRAEGCSSPALNICKVRPEQPKPYRAVLPLFESGPYGPRPAQSLKRKKKAKKKKKVVECDALLLFFLNL